jgi:hypothetical protein
MGFKAYLVYILRRIFLPKRLRTKEWLMLRLVNRDRRRHGLKPLFMQNDLRVVARKHSKDMALRGYFEHENMAGKSHADRYRESQISDVVSGENLAKIGGYPHPVHRAEIGLMNSPGHRANILNKQYNCVGIGIHKSVKKVYYFTQNFAYRTLIFSKNPPSSVKLKRGLTLYFKPIKQVQRAVYRVSDFTGVLAEHSFRVQSGKNRLQIKFKKTGHYTIELFTGSKNSKTLKLSNHIKVRVKTGLFG